MSNIIGMTIGVFICKIFMGWFFSNLKIKDVILETFLFGCVCACLFGLLRLCGVHIG